MNENKMALLTNENEEAFIIRKLFYRYIKYWKYFLAVLLLFTVLAVLYIRYSSVIYESIAKVKIIDASKETNIATEPLALMNLSGSINLQNEKEVLKSYRLLSQVVMDLDLDIEYREVGRIKTAEIWNPPFTITKSISNDTIEKTLHYEIEIENDRIKIIDQEDMVYFTSFDAPLKEESSLPFSLNFNVDNFLVSEAVGYKYQIVLKPFKKTVLDLAKYLEIQNTDKKSEILELSIKGESPEKSEAILNTIITKFNLDGVLDRQEVFKRTLEFIDERFTYLSSELDSIEGGKESFKRTNNLSYIEADAGISLERKSETEVESANLETQVSLSALLKKTVINQASYSLLPVDIGLENGGLNILVNNYNELALDREKLSAGVGEEHPTLVALSEQLERAKVNILKTINVYQTQLKTSLRQLNQEKSRANTIFSRLPEKEKTLRSIERQQSIKENLFLLLLQKREEAAINLAVTAPTIKIVDYALTDSKPIAPKRIVAIGAALVLGLLFPFSILYLKFALNTKVQYINDIRNIVPNIPVVGEVPYLKGDKLFRNFDDRSLMAESFRIIASNINYLLRKNHIKGGKIVYVTSSIENEGKSLSSYNLSVALASLNKKVLLVGADLRKPKLHDYFEMGEKTKGFSNFLDDDTSNISDFIYPGVNGNVNHKVCLSGPIPSNAPLLLASERYNEFILTVRKDFDYVIMDTAPTTLVTDTLLIADQADITLFVVRTDVTDKDLIDVLRQNLDNERLSNVTVLLNDVKSNTKKKYSYT